MKKKLLISMLLCALLVSATACGGKDNKTAKDETQTEATATVTPTNTPLPTAEVTETENTDGSTAFTNVDGGYHVNYDKKTLQMTNENSTVTFKLADTIEKSTEEDDETSDKDTTTSVDPNVFVSITAVEDITLEEYKTDMKKAFGKSVIVENSSVGMDIKDAYLFTFKKTGDTVHEIYLFERNEKVWMLEIKYPKKGKNKKAIVDLLDSLQFDSEK